MGSTPLFELFASPLSFHLTNYVQRFGWGCSSEKSNPWLSSKFFPSLIALSCTVVLKNGISLTLLILMLSSKLSSSRWDILYVDVKIALPPVGTFLMLMSLLTSKLFFLQILDVDINVALKVILPSDGTSSMCPQPRTRSSTTQRWTRANLSQR